MVFNKKDIKTMHRRTKKGQTTIEYVVLLIIVIGAFVAIQNYMKRGLQGRWKASIDQLGDQYDPRTAVTNIRHSTYVNTNTSIITITSNTLGGYWTKRTDVSFSEERKTGDTSVGAY